MLGAIVGDIVGSRFEFHNIKSKEFELFTDNCFFTDDSVMTLAIADAFLKCKEDYSDLKEICIERMVNIGRNYPNSGYGGNFFGWIFGSPEPYNSFGNGSAMRVSPCGLVGNSIDEVKRLSKIVTEISHNHPEGIKGAEATAVCVYLAKVGKNKEEIKKYVVDNYYDIDFTLDEIRESYSFNETCQKTVPQALECFFESTSFEDAIRNAISIGGDSDTIGAITGSIAAEYYKLDDKLKVIEKKSLTYLDERLMDIYNRFEEKHKT